MGQMTRRSAAEKREIIHLVDHSALPVGRTLDELDVLRSSSSRMGTPFGPRAPARRRETAGTVYRWYQQYQQEGEEGLEPQPSKRRQFWNRRPEPVCDQIVQLV